MAETITARSGPTAGNGPTGTHPPLDDPDLIEEWEALDDPQDRADYLEALESIEETQEEDLASWEEVKAELGF